MKNQDKKNSGFASALGRDARDEEESNESDGSVSISILIFFLCFEFYFKSQIL
jgi:hypothetical protein